MSHTARTLRRVLDPENLNICIKDYDSPEHFNELWRMELGGTTNFVIVWAGTPADPSVSPVNTEPSLTPYDWAMAACTLNEKLRVTVIDLRANEHDRAENGRTRYPALRWLETQKPQCVPWLRRFTVQQLLAKGNVVELREWIGQAPKSDIQVKARDALRALPVCQVDLTGKDDHHDIANLIGPLLLIRDSAIKRDHADHRLALCAMLHAAGYIPLSQSTDPDQESACARLPLSDLGPIRFVLVDDQWHHGWAQWLTERLGLTWDEGHIKKARPHDREEPQCIAGEVRSGVSLWVSSAPHWLLQRAINAKGEDRDARFRLRLTSEPEGPQERSDAKGEPVEILLLDLRLLPKGKEADFISEVAKASNFFLEKSAWNSSFQQNELDSARAKANDQEARAHLLTLFPRFLAQNDFSLPIILFSSTARREPLGKLRDYQSIFPQFAKPRLLGEAINDIRRRAEETFQEALDAALRWAAARRLCQKILDTADMHPPIERKLGDEFQHFELYIDESGNADKGEKDRFLLAGLLIGYRNSEDWKSLHDKMKTAGLEWWDWTNLDRDLLPHKAVKVEQRQEILAKFLDCSSKRYPIFGICLEHREESKSGDLEKARQDDGRYRAMLARLVELMLFDVVPATADAGASLSIFVATRVRKAKDIGASIVRRMREAYGYFGGGSNDEAYYQSFAQDAVVSIVTQVLDRRARLPGERNLTAGIEIARGVGLKYNVEERGKPEKERTGGWRETRHQHYMADILGGLCRFGGAEFHDERYKEVFEKGIFEFSNATLDAALGAARSLAESDHSSAILELANLDFTSKLESRSAVALIISRLAASIRTDLMAEEFARVARKSEPREQFLPRMPVGGDGSDVPPAEEGRGDGDYSETVAANEPADDFLRGEGNVRGYRSDKNFGFISRKSRDDIFFHVSAWRGEGWPADGIAVEFKAFFQPDRRKWKAVEVRPS